MTEKREINPVLKQVLELGPPLAFFGLYLWLKEDVFLFGGQEYSGFIVATVVFVPIVLLAMPFHGNNIDTLRQLRAGGFAGTVAVVAQYDEDLRQATRSGATVGFQLYDGAGAELADRAAVAAGLDVPGPAADARRGSDRPSEP